MSCDYGSYIRNDGAQDYHDMIGDIFQEMKEIRDNGAIRLTVEFGSGRKHDIIEIPVIQFIIGDCKGNDLLRGIKCGRSLNMKGLCRDCNVKLLDGDDTCIVEDLQCTFHNLDNVVGKTQEQLNE